MSDAGRNAGDALSNAPRFRIEFARGVAAVVLDAHALAEGIEISVAELALPPLRGPLDLSPKSAALASARTRATQLQIAISEHRLQRLRDRLPSHFGLELNGLRLTTWSWHGPDGDCSAGVEVQWGAVPPPAAPPGTIALVPLRVEAAGRLPQPAWQIARSHLDAVLAGLSASAIPRRRSPYWLGFSCVLPVVDLALAGICLRGGRKIPAATDAVFCNLTRSAAGLKATWSADPIANAEAAKSDPFADARFAGLVSLAPAAIQLEQNGLAAAIVELDRASLAADAHPVLLEVLVDALITVGGPADLARANELIADANEVASPVAWSLAANVRFALASSEEPALHSGACAIQLAACSTRAASVHDALEFAERALAQRPSEPGLLKLVADKARSAGDAQREFALRNELLSLLTDPHMLSRCRLDLARLALHWRHNTDEAAAHLKHARRLGAHSADIDEAQAEIHLALEQPALAIQALAHALEGSRDTSEIVRLRLRAASVWAEVLGDNELAAREAGAAVDLAPANVDALLALTRYGTLARRFADVADAYTRALALLEERATNDAAANSALADVLLVYAEFCDSRGRSGDAHEARVRASEVSGTAAPVERAPGADDAEILRRRAEQLKRAATSARGVAEKASALAEYGVFLYQDCGDAAGALEALLDWMVIDGASPDSRALSAAEAAAREVDDPLALLAIYERRAALDAPGAPTWNLLRTDTLARLGRFDEALASIDSMLLVAPSDETLIARRSHLREQTGDIAGARADIERLLSLVEVDSYERIELLRRAIALPDTTPETRAAGLRAIVEAVPGDHDAASALASLLEELGDHAGAIELIGVRLGRIAGSNSAVELASWHRYALDALDYELAAQAANLLTVALPSLDATRRDADADAIAALLVQQAELVPEVLEPLAFWARDSARFTLAATVAETLATLVFDPSEQQRWIEQARRWKKRAPRAPKAAPVHEESAGEAAVAAVDECCRESSWDAALELVELWLPRTVQPALRRSLLVRRGRILLALDRAEDARMSLRGALILDPAAVDTRVELAVWAATTGDFERAKGLRAELVSEGFDVAQSDAMIAGRFEQLNRLLSGDA